MILKLLMVIPRFDRRFADFNALDVANEWIKHTYNNGFSLPSMPF